jgi:hypothetical protein
LGWARIGLAENAADSVKSGVNERENGSDAESQSGFHWAALFEECFLGFDLR